MSANSLTSGSGSATADKVRWVLEAAGGRTDTVELSVTVFTVVVTDHRDKAAAQIAPRFGLPPSEVLNSPHVLVGTIDQITEDLERRREIYGFSYVIFGGNTHEAMAPVVARLTGT